MASRLQTAKAAVQNFFEGQAARVFREDEFLPSLVAEPSLGWRIGRSRESFLDFLTQKSCLRKVVMSSDSSSVTRYVWGEASIYEIAQSIQKEAYLTHETAARLHILTESNSKIIYVNHEQSFKQPRNVSLTQQAIDSAFASPQRVSRSLFAVDDFQVLLISGKHTGLGIETVMTQNGGSLNVTNIERTLIDIAVRPAYAGGVMAVRDCFRSARKRVSGKLLAMMLQKLNYIYPYHQCIGFYMELAGYDSRDTALFSAIPMVYDFYLTHGADELEYSKKWRLFYPAHL